MSLRPSLAGAVPASTAMVAGAAFPRGNPYMRLRDTLGPVFTDQQFALLFPGLGQPAEAPWRLALVTLLQFAETLSERRAADATTGPWPIRLRSSGRASPEGVGSTGDACPGWSWPTLASMRRC